MKFILTIIMIGMCVSAWGGNLDDSDIVDGATTTPEMWTDLYNALTGDSTYDNVVFSIDSTKYIYQAAISQTGTAAPTELACFINTFGIKPVWSRVLAGYYMATLDSSYGTSRIFAKIIPGTSFNVQSFATGSKTLSITNVDLVDMAGSDTTAFWIEIQVKQ